MAVVPMKRAVITEAERRGKLEAEHPGDFVFNDFNDYIQAMAAQVRVSGLTATRIAAQSDTIKSGSTVTHLAYGWTDYKSRQFKRTQQPRFSTMFGIANALGLEVTFRRRPR